MKKKKQPMTFGEFVANWDHDHVDKQDYSIPFVFNSLDGTNGFMYFKYHTSELVGLSCSLMVVTDIYFMFSDMDTVKHLDLTYRRDAVCIASNVPTIEERLPLTEYISRSENLYGYFNPYELVVLLGETLFNMDYVRIYCEAIRYVQKYLVAHQHNDWKSDPVDDGTMRICPTCGKPVPFNSHFHAYICNNCFWESSIV